MVNGTTFPVLDHGYVSLIESWGSDERIVESARMSTGKGFLGWGPALKCKTCGAAYDTAVGGEKCGNPSPGREYVDTGRGNHIFENVPGDEKLLRYLYENKHSTPFEMAGVMIEVQAPIFVFREWHRHRTQSYNEMSARYAPLPNLNYIPTVERLLINAGTSNKQAGTVAGSGVLDTEGAEEFRRQLALTYETSEMLYQASLKVGIPKELARIRLPVGRYSRMRASACLRNWLSFLTLRSDKNPGAQWEIRQFANTVGKIIAELFPRTWALFAEG